jgi:transglutaminase/protease-like cytokinesis protein 3
MVVKGTAKGSPEGVFEPHGWIFAYINGRWRHIDPTFDCTLSYGKKIRKDYFQLTDDEIQKDHCWDRQRYPKAVRDY